MADLSDFQPVMLGLIGAGGPVGALSGAIAGGIRSAQSNYADDSIISGLKRGFAGGGFGGSTGASFAILPALSLLFLKNKDTAERMKKVSLGLGLAGGILGGATTGYITSDPKFVERPDIIRRTKRASISPSFKITAALARAFRDAGYRGALGKVPQGLDEAYNTAAGKLKARAALFGTPKPNLEVVPGITEKIDTIIDAG